MNETVDTGKQPTTLVIFTCLKHFAVSSAADIGQSMRDARDKGSNRRIMGYEIDMC